MVADLCAENIELNPWVSAPAGPGMFSMALEWTEVSLPTPLPGALLFFAPAAYSTPLKPAKRAPSAITTVTYLKAANETGP